MTHPESVIVTHFFIVGAEIQIQTSDGQIHLCRNVPRYDLDRLHLHLKQPQEKGKSLISVLTLTTEAGRFHFTWTAASILNPGPLVSI